MNTKTLTQERCVPCEGDVQAFTPAQVAVYAPQVPDWTILDDKKLEKQFKFKDFAEALRFINKVGAVAETEGHHPDINLHSWNKVTITLWTHAIKGLFLNDFILAAKIDALI